MKVKLKYRCSKKKLKRKRLLLRKKTNSQLKRKKRQNNNQLISIITYDTFYLGVPCIIFISIPIYKINLIIMSITNSTPGLPMGFAEQVMELEIKLEEEESL
jgi:hypothetical protein